MNLLVPFADIDKQHREWLYQVGECVGLWHKQAAVPAKVYALSGRLYLSKSGWLLLSVPNSLVRGAYDALDEVGISLPVNEAGVLEAHISVMDPDEIASIGGSDKITERGHFFTYSTGPVKSVEPSGWAEMSRVWYITVDSPDLRSLRKSYGLEPLRKGHDQHITIAVRRKNVLRDNNISKIGV